VIHTPGVIKEYAFRDSAVARKTTIWSKKLDWSYCGVLLIDYTSDEQTFLEAGQKKKRKNFGGP